MTPPSDRQLLQGALAAIELVLERKSLSASGTPALEALGICLNSASLLMEVSDILLRESHTGSSDELVREWQALIKHTKVAGRSAHQAALILAEQSNIVAAQHGITVRDEAIALQEPA
jgi:hypothetical protein